MYARLRVGLALSTLLAAVALARPAGLAAQQAPRVSTTEAARYKGQQATVCGVVAKSTLAAKVGGAPTFIDFDKPNPDQTFTVLIWGIDRPKFAAPPESTYVAGKRVCVTGGVVDYRGRPEIVVHQPGDIWLEKTGK